MVDLGDELIGGGGADHIVGSRGDDRLIGAAGDDWQYGGVGNDLFVGGNGADRNSGGAGADLFDFNALAETGVGAGLRDIIIDFRSVDADLVIKDLTAIDTQAGTAANQAFTFIGTAAFTAEGGGPGPCWTV